MQKPFDVPVLLIIFRRADFALQVVEELRKAQVQRLYITADAPRQDKFEETNLCNETWERVLNAIDWPCELKTYRRKINGGQRYGYADQLDWFFREVEEGIILEDDAVPEQSFFPYCAELLTRYRNNPDVMFIGGFHIRDKFPELQIHESYRFVRMPMGYGWATWCRVWQLYDVDMKDFYKHLDTPQLRANFGDEGAYQRWRYVWLQCVEKKLSVWDAPFVFTILSHGGLCISPAHNLIHNIGTNIGMTPSGTHLYTDSQNQFLNMPTRPMKFPLIHPKKIEIDDLADKYLYRYYFGIDRKPLYYYVARPMRNMFPEWYQRLKKLVKRI